MQLLHPPIAPWLVRTASGCRVQLLSDQGAPDAVFLRAMPHNEEELIPMQPAGRCGALWCWQADMPWDDGNTNTHYAFKVLHGRRQTWLAADGMHPHPQAESVLFRVSRHTPPAWVRDQVFYQVLPDRFDRAAPPRDRRGEQVFGARALPVLQPAWGAPLDPSQAQKTFYGGDLDGIARRLDHVQNTVGASAIYLNPIFTAGSNHRYDTEDYENVDPELGGNAALAELAEALHRRGMRLMLDAVVNHTGSNHPWFNRWGTHATLGAAQSPASPWRGWYAFDGQGRALGWKGHASLPVLDFAHPGVRDAVYAAPHAILRRWLRAPYAIDGWRLDVIHMLGEGPGAWRNAAHLRAMRAAIKEENRDAFVLGGTARCRCWPAASTGSRWPATTTSRQRSSWPIAETKWPWRYRRRRCRWRYRCGRRVWVQASRQPLTMACCAFKLRPVRRCCCSAGADFRCGPREEPAGTESRIV
jgi:alpha-glucosidase